MQLPKIGLWTWKVHDEAVFYDALSLWYRHFDTAWIYHNEERLGKVFKDYWKRDELWISSKIRFDYVPDYSFHVFKDEDFLYSQLEDRFLKTLNDLRTDYLDLVYLHWPTWYENDAKAFEKLLQYKREGRILHLWVSNFPKGMLEKFYSLFWNEIEYLQTERHACLGDQLLEGFCKEKNINIVAYSPFWHGHLLKDERLKVLASENWISVSQMLLAYLLNKGFFVIPKSSNFQRLQENIEAWRVVLSENTVQSIECLEKHFRYNNPPFAPRYE